eukprot:TRINITY_DN236_c0_g2_i1.p1 TRINITY_DN236_c0_g2~~TRINITY_DN236_c0_g2_i1.p1  ORF type:complete len:309 (+),score=108.71 TRINITY_DN236_c0_g2_i1:377-1303(+)
MAYLTRVVRAAAMAVAAAALVTAATPAAAQEGISVDLCRALTYYNVFTIGDAHLERTEVTGPLAVGGAARLSRVAVNSGGTCAASAIAPLRPALAVGGRLNARGGSVKAGAVILRRGAWLGPLVSRECARVYHGPVDFSGLAAAHKVRHGIICDRREELCRTEVDDDGDITMTARQAVSPSGIAAVATCIVRADDLARASRVALVGRRGLQVAVVKVVGGRGLTLADVKFSGMDAIYVAIILCNVSSLVIDGVDVPAAIIGPDTHLSGASGTVHGTVVAHSLRGGVTFRHEPTDCGRLRPAASPAPRI